MAIMKLVSVFDKKADAFNTVMSVGSLGIAIRDFTDAFSSADNKMSKYRDDFSLYHLGDFDSVTGNITPMTVPKLVFNGSDIGAKDE